MRVIAGSAGRRRLICPQGETTRPTSDRIKETLFNILQTEIVDTAFLDLFSGSGGIGIEALSRGSRTCVFVEKDKNALSCIRKNLQTTGFTAQARVMAMDAVRALYRLSAQKESFDIIFMDPPYRMGLEEKVFPVLFSLNLVKEGTLIVIEMAADTDFSVPENLSCEVERVKNYGTNRHLFLRVGGI